MVTTEGLVCFWTKANVCKNTGCNLRLKFMQINARYMFPEYQEDIGFRETDVNVC